MAKTELSVVTQLAELITRATQDDVAKIDEDIAAKRAEIDSLNQLRKLIAVRLGIEEPKKGPGGHPRKHRAVGGGSPQPAANGTPAADGGRGGLMRARRLSAARLLGNRGPLVQSVICEELDIPAGSITSVLDCDWFEKTPQGVRVTSVGRNEAIGPGK